MLIGISSKKIGHDNSMQIYLVVKAFWAKELGRKKRFSKIKVFAVSQLWSELGGSIGYVLTDIKVSFKRMWKDYTAFK